jgi:hypothetical protein
LAPTGTAAVLLELRSTAGSCFGRFIGLYPLRENSKVASLGNPTSMNATPTGLQARLSEAINRHGAKNVGPGKSRGTHVGSHGHRGALGRVAIHGGQLLWSFHCLLRLRDSKVAFMEFNQDPEERMGCSRVSSPSCRTRRLSQEHQEQALCSRSSLRGSHWLPPAPRRSCWSCDQRRVVASVVSSLPP